MGDSPGFFFVCMFILRAVNEEAARYICDELRDSLECRRFFEDVDSMYLYLRPIKIALNSLQGHGTNLTDGLVLFDELQDYFNEDNEIWNIFNVKWELCGSDLWQASACVDLRYNENYNNIKKDPKYEEYLRYERNNRNNSNNNNSSNNINDEEKEKSLFDSIVTSFRSNINGRNVQRSIDRYLFRINNNGSNIFNNRNKLVPNGMTPWDFVRPAYLEYRAARGPWNPLLANFQS